jgi:membrane protein YdbS with pleckstrin-like domain
LLEYFWGSLAGIAYGCLVGAFKYFILWRGVLNPKKEKPVTDKMVYIRMMISFVINFITLIVTYFVRNIIPFDFVAFAVTTALALSFSGRFFPISKILSQKNYTYGRQ